MSLQQFKDAIALHDVMQRNGTEITVVDRVILLTNVNCIGVIAINLGDNTSELWEFNKPPVMINQLVKEGLIGEVVGSESNLFIRTNADKPIYDIYYAIKTPLSRKLIKDCEIIDPLTNPPKGLPPIVITPILHTNPRFILDSDGVTYKLKDENRVRTKRKLQDPYHDEIAKIYRSYFNSDIRIAWLGN